MEDILHHQSSQFDAELSRLRNDVLKMGGLVETQVSTAIEAYGGCDLGIAKEIVARDQDINALEKLIDDESTQVIARRLAAALKPSATPRLMDRRFGDWRILADEYDHENWLDEDDAEQVDAVLDAVLVRGARFCPVLLTVVNEREEDIKAAGVITDVLRFPGDPARRWLDRRVLREVMSEARAMPAQ